MHVMFHSAMISFDGTLPPVPDAASLRSVMRSGAPGASLSFMNQIRRCVSV